MACLEQLECMSALLDGELTAEETTLLQRHLATCPSCKRAFEAMTGLGSTLTTAEPPELPSDFARKTADFVREHAFPQGPPPPPARTRRWFEGLWTGQHPILALVGARRRRPSLRASEMLKALAIFALPALALAIFRDGMPLMNFVLVSGLGLMVAVPVYYFNNEIALLSSLIKGRCLEEVLGTSLEPRSTVDALAVNSLRPILKAILPVAPVLLLGALAMPTSQQVNLAPTEADHRWIVMAAAVWLPLTLGLFLSASYISMAWRIWCRSTRLSVVGGLALALAGTTMLLGKAAIPAAILVAALYTLVARRLAIVGLEHPEQVTRLNQTTRKARRNRFLKLWSDNPITAREVWRVSGSVPGGLAGMFAWRLTLITLPLLWSFWAITRPYGEQDFAFWLGVSGFSFLLFVRAAYRTLGSVLTERQQQTWEPLLQTDLGAARFVRGWLEVAFHTVMLEGLVGAVALTLFAWLIPAVVTSNDTVADAHRVALLVPCVLLFCTLVGALTGMALSASSRSLNEASQRLGLCSVLSLGGWLTLWGVLLSGGYLLALNSYSDTGSMFWNDFVQHDAPLAAALLTALGLMLWSNAVLRREVTRLEAQPTSSKTRLRFTYPLPVMLIELVGVCLVSYLSLLLTVLVSARYALDRDETIGVVMLVGALIAYYVLVRLPLATLVELVRGSLWSVPLGLALGALAGWSLQLLPVVLSYLAARKVIYSNTWIDGSVPFVASVGLVVLGGLLGYREARRARSTRRPALKLRLALSGSLSLLVLGGTAWSLLTLWNVKVQDPAAVAEIRNRTEQRFARLQAVEPDENGYTELEEMLMDRVNPTSRYADWRDLGNLDEDQADATLLKVLRTEKGVDARARFSGVLPRLEHALSKPAFSYHQELDARSLLPNFILIRQMARGLATLGFAEESEGHLDQAVHHYLLGLKWGDRCSGQGTLIFEMMAVAVEAIPAERLLSLETSHKLTAEQYRAIIRQVESTRFGPNSVAEALEAELVYSCRLLELSPKERGQAESALGVPAPQAYLDYEKANLCNYFAEAIPAVRRSRVTQPATPTGHLSLLASVLVPNYTRAQQQMMANLTRLEAIRTIAALELYRIDHRAYPASLDLLVGPYLESKPIAYIAYDQQFVYRPGFEFELSCNSPLKGASWKREDWKFYPFVSKRTR